MGEVCADTTREHLRICHLSREAPDVLRMRGGTECSSRPVQAAVAMVSVLLFGALFFLGVPIASPTPFLGVRAQMLSDHPATTWREGQAMSEQEARRLYLSNTKVTLWEKCGKAYESRYIKHLPSAAGPAAGLGRAVHRTLELLLMEGMASERLLPLSRERATKIFQAAFVEEELVGAALFEEGLRMVHGFVEDEGVFDHRGVMAVEHPFKVQLGSIGARGVIDRIELLPDGGVRIVDYKTGRLLPTPDELATGLQLTLYEAVVRRIYPWVTRVELAIWNVRHRVRMATSRTPEQVAAVFPYLEAIGAALSQATVFPARIGTHCAFCDYRQGCSDYQAVLDGTGAVPSVPLDDVEAVASERQGIAARIRILTGRQKELDRALRQHLGQADEVRAAGKRFRLLPIVSRRHELATTAAVLARGTDLSATEAAARVGVVDKNRLRRLLADVAKTRGSGHAAMLRVEVDALAKERHTQKLWITSATT